MRMKEYTKILHENPQSKGTGQTCIVDAAVYFCYNFCVCIL